MYQVIARKYRPQSFAEVVNQEHVKSTLENAIVQGRIAHGYIFSGQRGTGKTTVARILARCLNCVNGPLVTPCGVCASCLEIAAGGSVDVIEIDAASNRGINEMRELRENVRYQPARDRYKVFIVDEAHQITTEAFNALLKTIEEPPAWVVFILCTTEAHKIPATIASRCQHFSFRSVEFEDLVARMEWICRQEGIETDPESLAALAQAGEGSVRDSLSALDQAIACCGGRLDAAGVRALLGAFSLDTLHQVSAALAGSDSAAMLGIVDSLERSGQNLQHFSRELARYFRNLLVARITGKDTRLISASSAERERLAGIAAGFSEEDLTRYLQLALDVFRDLQFSLQPRFHLEIGLVKMVHAGRLTSIEEALAGLSSGGGEPAAPRPRAASPVLPATAPPAPRLQASPQPVAPPAPPPVAPVAAAQAPPSGEEWKPRLCAALVELGMTFTADGVGHSNVVEAAGTLEFTTPREFMLAMKADDLNKAVRHIIGRTMKIQVKPGEGAAPAARKPANPAEAEDEVSRRALDNPEVQRFRDLLGGQVRQIRNLKE